MAELSKEFLEAFDSRTKNLLGTYKTHKNDERAILEWKISDVNGKLNAARVGGGGNLSKLNEELQGLHQQLREAKMKDTEVLKAAQALASNGKDEKTKSFGKGLVDFYKKNNSFTPDQVAGLQNIMKNASFQMAKEEKSEGQTLRKADDTSEKQPMDKVTTDKKEGLEEAKLTGDDVKSLDKIKDLDKMKKAAIDLLGGTSTSDRKKVGLAQNIKTANKADKVLSIMYNALLSGEGMSTVGSKWQKDMKEEKQDDGEGMDPVKKKALKKDFEDRKDKDIDNDGDSDDSDEYLHKRRKTISKEVSKDK